MSEPMASVPRPGTGGEPRAATPAAAGAASADAVRPETTGGSSKLERIRALLAAGQVEEVQRLVSHRDFCDPELKNAAGVCLLRLGKYAEAVTLFRSLALAANQVNLRPDAPLHFKTNFATALLLSGHLRGCEDVLAELHDDDHPLVARLLQAIDRWKASLTFWQRLRHWLGGDLAVEVKLDFPPGDV
jgi:hypothetical protein